MRVDVEREPALRKEIMITFKQTVALIIEMVLHYNISYTTRCIVMMRLLQSCPMPPIIICLGDVVQMIKLFCGSQPYLGCQGTV